jgi:hypothetical protein
MWATRVSFNKSLKEFPVHCEAIASHLWNVYQTSDGMDAIIKSEEADIADKFDRTIKFDRERLWSNLDLAKSYMVFLKNQFDDNTDGIVFNGILDEQLQSDNPDNPEMLKGHYYLLETYQSTPKQV